MRAKNIYEEKRPMKKVFSLSTLNDVEIPDELTYIGAFLTFRCHFNCSYCINYQGQLKVRKELMPLQWINGLNRLQIKRDRMVPITFQGGEPSDYPGFIDVIKKLKDEFYKDEFYIDILTNLGFDVMEFIDEIPPEKMQRDVPYASIRATFHPDKIEINEFLGKIFNLRNKGYSIESYGINHPELFYFDVLEKCRKLGVDFTMKEFFGRPKRKLYGTYKYPGGVNGKKRVVECKTTELLIGPNGDIHKCRRDLHYNENPLGNIMDEELEIKFKYQECKNFGECSYYDVRLKKDRFGEKEVCPVEIREIT